VNLEFDEWWLDLGQREISLSLSLLSLSLRFLPYNNKDIDPPLFRYIRPSLTKYTINLSYFDRIF
jgi:hypothetical protein